MVKERIKLMFLTVLLFFSCTDGRSKINLDGWVQHSEKITTFSIEQSDYFDNEFLMCLQFYFGGDDAYETICGIVKAEKNKIILNPVYQFSSLDSAVLFDFNMQVGDTHFIEFSEDNKNFANFHVVLDKIIAMNESDNIFVFCIKDIHYGCYDYVYFISKKEGVKGWFIQKIENGIQYIFHEQGNIYPEYIDYSRSEFDSKLD